jgi:hypothetical protein
MKALYSWVIAGTLTLVLATGAVAVMVNTPAPPTPLSEPVSAHDSTPSTSTPPTTEAPTTEAPTTEAPTTMAPTTLAPTTLPPTTLAPVPTTVTYTYSGDDGQSYSSSGSSAGGSYNYGGDD